MANKAAKTLAAKNSKTLNRVHLTSVSLHLLFWTIHLFLRPRSLLRYILCSLPAILIELWFERGSRPKYTSDGSNDLRRAGEDLEAKGLTEWMWDVLLYTWGCLCLASVAGDWVWWAYAVVPLYSAWLLWGVYTGARGMLGGGESVQEGTAEGAGGQSKRQAKMEKRGGQRMQYR